MAFAVVSCKVAGAPLEVASRSVSGSYSVQYTVEISKDGTTFSGFVGPKSVLAACQALPPPITAILQPIPRRWSRYDYTWLLGGISEKDLGSFCKDWIVQPTNERRTHWTIIALFSRLQPGEIPNVDELAREITNPINWYPRYYLRKFVLGEQLDAGWPRDPIAGDGFAANAPDTKVYGPFTQNGVVKDPDRHPLDDQTLTPDRYFFGIDHPTAIDAEPITRANLISPTNFPVIKREYGLLHVRMNWPDIESFWLADQAQKYTVWNGGQDWKANTEGGPDFNSGTGRKFFTCRWGQAKYEGGSIIGDPQVDDGQGYYVGEFRYQLLFDRDAIVRVRNDSTIDIDGLPIKTAADDGTGNPVFADEPQWLDLEGNWLGASVTTAGERTANWIRWWYGGGYDYATVTNGGVVAKSSGGTQPIQVGMFSTNEIDWHFPDLFPYPTTVAGETAFVPFPPL